MPQRCHSQPRLGDFIPQLVCENKEISAWITMRLFSIKHMNIGVENWFHRWMIRVDLRWFKIHRTSQEIQNKIHLTVRKGQATWHKSWKYMRTFIMLRSSQNFRLICHRSSKHALHSVKNIHRHFEPFMIEHDHGMCKNTSINSFPKIFNQ